MEHQPKIVKHHTVTVGRSVHYYDANMRLRTATVTEVSGKEFESVALVEGQPPVALLIMPPFAPPVSSDDWVSFSAEPKALHWTWPPRA